MKIRPIIAMLAALSVAPASLTIFGSVDDGDARSTAELWADVEIVAHRGASHDAPENTLAAVTLAWEMGADAVEFDVHLTSDNQLVAIHDKDTKRVAGEKHVVARTPLSVIQSLDVGRWKDPAFTGERAPTIDEVLATMPREPGSEHKRFYIEIKVGPESVPPLMAALDKADLPAEQTPVISFNYDTCREVKRQRPQLPVYFLSSFKEKDDEPGVWTPTAGELIKQAKQANLDGLDLSAKGPVDKAFIDEVEAAGLAVYMWTIDDPAVADRLVKAGAKGITTNRPDVMLSRREPSASSGSRKAR